MQPSVKDVMDYFFLVGTLTLLLQLAVFFLLVGGVLLKRRQMYREKGFAMFLAVFLHLVTIGVIMVPSFTLGLVPIIAKSPTQTVSMLSLLHVILGGTAAVIGVWIVGTWRFRRSLQYCAPKRRWMKVTFWVWLSSLGSGFVFYLVLFKSLLFG